MKFFSLSFYLHINPDFQLKRSFVLFLRLTSVFKLYMMIVTRTKGLQQLELHSNKKDNKEV